MPTTDERMNAGKSLRRAVPRSSHAEFSRQGSFDAVDLLLSQEEGRLEGLIPIRRQRMAESAFAFYRAGAKLMAVDLASTPRTNILVQACGDAHVSNFGWYGSPERSLVFDVNDFDETLIATWEWDLKRLAASFVIAGRDNGFTQKDQRAPALAVVRSYQRAMRQFAKQPVLDVWYAHISARDVLDHLTTEGHTKAAKRASKEARKARKKDSRHVLGKLGENVDGRYRIIDDAPFVVPIRSPEFAADVGEVTRLVEQAVSTYDSTLAASIRTLVNRFSVIDIALKVVGVGSVGTRCFIVMLEGNDREDILFLQVKEAGPSVLEDEFGASAFAHAGERVVEGQRMMQSSSDIMLGWITSDTGRMYYVRQLKDMKASPDIGKFDGDDMVKYAKVCGTVLARAHARSGDPAAITGYIGTGDVFGDAIKDFAVAYANQNDTDYASYLDRMEQIGSA
ncbi:MAG: DUF2252 domain-containing protein [Proteobacteria bacterium]|nr:DUF2252 domain-containing protein [Pseudomonadota bacterium]